MVWRETTVKLALIGILLLSFTLESRASAAETPQQKTSTPVKKKAPAPLSPEEKEAQMHYRVALEALKNNDLVAAQDELTQASKLAPKNGLIWYNLAVVESKSNDPKSAMAHLQKALDLGIPKGMADEADDLKAQLTYAARKQALSEKLRELGTLMVAVYPSPCTVNGVIPPGGKGLQSESFYFSKFDGCRAILLSSHDYEEASQGSQTDMLFTDNYQLDLGDLVSDVSVVDRLDKCTGRRGEEQYWVYLVKISAAVNKQFLDQMDQKFSGVIGGHALPEKHFVNGTFASDKIELPFLQKEKAQQAAHVLSEAIQMCSTHPAQ
jgi:tetratricopeptide (TPR) repeat protein